MRVTNEPPRGPDGDSSPSPSPPRTPEPPVSNHRVADALVEAVFNPHRPIPPAAICDFGIESQKHWKVIYYVVALDGVTADDLHRTLMEGGPALTALLRSAPGNPHPHLTFRLVWDHDDMQEPPADDDVSDDS